MTNPYLIPESIVVMLPAKLIKKILKEMNAQVETVEENWPGADRKLFREALDILTEQYQEMK